MLDEPQVTVATADAAQTPPEPAQAPESERDAVRHWWEITSTTPEWQAACARWQVDVAMLEGAPEDEGTEDSARQIYHRTMRNRDLLLAMLIPDGVQPTFKPAEDVDDRPDLGGPQDEAEEERAGFARTLTKLLRLLLKRARGDDYIEGWVSDCISFRWGIFKWTHQRDLIGQTDLATRPDDMQDQVAEMQVLLGEMERGKFTKDSHLFDRLQALVRAIQGRPQVEIREGLDLGILPLDRFMVSPEVRILEDIDKAEWMREDHFMTRTEVQALLKVDARELGRASVYAESGRLLWAAQGMGAGAEQSGNEERTARQATDEDLLRVREIWCLRELRRILLVEGLDRFAWDETPRNRPERWYPYHVWTVNRSSVRPYGISQTEIQEPIEDDVIEGRRLERDAKEAALPRGVYSAEAIHGDDAVTINRIPAFSFAPIKGLRATSRLEETFFPLPTAGNVNPQLYDTSKRERDQDTAALLPAQLRGETGTADFATEVQVAAQGSNVSLGKVRKRLGRELERLMRAMAEVLIQEWGHDAVRAVIPDAVWPEELDGRQLLLDELGLEVEVSTQREQTTQQDRQELLQLIQALAALLQPGSPLAPIAVARLLGRAFGRQGDATELLRMDTDTLVTALARDPERAISEAGPEALQVLMVLGQQATQLLEQLAAEQALAQQAEGAPTTDGAAPAA